MRRSLSYANVAATLALVFSMSGGALAASHYLINSTKQISPKVLKKLRGATGRTGAAGLQGKEGPAGKEGAQGKEGKEGPSGPFPSGPLPAGKTVRGVYQALGQVANTSNERVLSSISFGYEMSAPLTTNVVEDGKPTAACPGSYAQPEAAAGNLCLYRNGALEANDAAVETYTPTEGGRFDRSSVSGVIVDVKAATANEIVQAGGAWAATAP